MVNARDKGLIPDLPDGVGTGWGTNGERVNLAVTTQDSPGAYQAGPVSMGVRDWSDPARALTMTMGPLPIPVDPHAYSVAAFMVTARTSSWQYDVLHDDAVPVWNKLDELDTRTTLDARREARGLYVMDGSRIAGSCAANLSMTIAALAEHSMTGSCGRTPTCCSAEPGPRDYSEPPISIATES